MAVDQPINGQVVVTLMDSLRAVYQKHPLANLVVLPAIAILGVGLSILSLAEPRGPHVALLVGGLVLVLLPIVPPAVHALIYLRLSTKQRQLHFVVDTERIAMRNGDGFVDAVYWGTVRWCREGARGFTFGVSTIHFFGLPPRFEPLQMNFMLQGGIIASVPLLPLGTRVIWLPKKAFAASAVRCLRRLVREKMGKSAFLLTED